MKLWIKQLSLLRISEKIFLLLFLIIQGIMAYFHFFKINGLITWNELIFSLVLIIPWILSFNFYLNFKILDFSSLFFRIRLSIKQRIIKVFIIIECNILLSMMMPLIIECTALLSKGFNIIETFNLIIETIFRYNLFLIIVSLVHIIFMRSYRRYKSLISVILYIIFFVMSYLPNSVVLLFLYPALYPPTLTIPCLLISIGYLFIFGIIYIFLEENNEYL